MKITSIKGLLLGASVLSALFSGAAAAQEKQNTEGNWVSSGIIVKTADKLCWRHGFWTPAMANAECDPDLVKKPEKKAEVKKEAPPVKKAAPEKIVFAADALFDFNKAVLKPEGMQAVDGFAAKLKSVK